MLRYIYIYVVAKLCLTLLQPHGLDRLLCSWGFSSKNTGVGCHFRHPGIFPTQGSSLHLLYWQMGSLPLSHLESSYIDTYHWEYDIYIYIIQSIVCHRTYYFYILKSSLELKVSPVHCLRKEMKGGCSLYNSIKQFLVFNMNSLRSRGFEHVCLCWGCVRIFFCSSFPTLGNKTLDFYADVDRNFKAWHPVMEQDSMGPSPISSTLSW